MTEATGPDVMIITCGKEFQREIAEFDDSQPFRGRHEKARAVQRALGLTQRLTYLVSVLDVGDPHHDKSLREHIGCHPHILEGTMATEHSATAMKALINMMLKCKEPVAVVIYCNRNRHRSVAAGWLAASCVGHLSGKTVTLERRNAKDSWPAMYGSCRGSCKICTHEMDEVKAAADKIIAKMGNLCAMGSDAMKEQSARQKFYMLGAVPPPPETEGIVGGAPLRRPSSQAEGSNKPKITPARAKSEGTMSKAAPKPTALAGRNPPMPPPPGRMEPMRSRSPKRTETPASSREAPPEPTPTETLLLAQLSRMQSQLDEMRKEKKERRRRSSSRKRSRSPSRRRRHRSDSRDSRREVRGRRASRRSRSLRRGRSETVSLRPLEPEYPPPGRSESRGSEGQGRGYWAWHVPHQQYHRAQWPAYWNFPVLRSGSEPWNRRVKVETLSEELLGSMYHAAVGTAGWSKKLRALRWIGPYYPGPGPEGRDMKTIEAANHETNIKVIVLEEWGTNTKAGDKKTHITDKMVEQGWKCTVYDYVTMWQMSGGWLLHVLSARRFRIGVMKRTPASSCWPRWKSPCMCCWPFQGVPDTTPARPKKIVMSPTSDDDVRVSYKPGNEAQLPLEALYSCCDLSSVTMGKREKEAFRNGLELVNEQDRVLTALVSNTPLDSTHMVVVTDSLLPWEKMDGVVILGIQDWNKTRKELSQIVSKKPPGLLVGLFSNGVQSAIMHDLMDEVDLHGSGLVVICPNETSQEFQSMSIETRGDMTVYLGGNQMTGLQEEITAWDRLGIAPRCFEDAKHWDLMETLCKKSEERYLGSYTRTCFVADAIIEEESEEMTPEEQEELTVMEKEQLMLDQLALPGAPLQEAERRALWRRLPQRTRVAIRRLRRQFGHPNPTTLNNILKAGRAPAELQEAARLVRCQACEDTKQKPRDHPVGLKTEFEFNACVGIDVAECKDYAGNKYSVMSMVDISTGFHVARVVKEGGTMPTSEICAKALMEGWTSWAGWPKMVTMDRGVHNRGNAEASGFTWMWSGVRALGDSKCHWQGGEIPRSDEGYAT